MHTFIQQTCVNLYKYFLIKTCVIFFTEFFFRSLCSLFIVIMEKYCAFEILTFIMHTPRDDIFGFTIYSFFSFRKPTKMVYRLLRPTNFVGIYAYACNTYRILCNYCWKNLYVPVLQPKSDTVLFQWWFIESRFNKNATEMKAFNPNLIFVFR